MDRKRLQLQPRLQMLADMVPDGVVVADIGTDHGYLPVWLLQEGKIPRAIASDIHADPLNHARMTAAVYGVSDRIDFRLCAGLEKMTPDEADCIIIAGMGGETIISILQAAPWSKENNVRLLLQPMTKAETLRSWLAVNGYCFTDERLVFDKKYLYPILCVMGGESRPLRDEEAYGGIMLENDPLWDSYLTQQMKKIRIRIDGLHRSASGADRDEISRLGALYEALSARKERLHEHGTGN